MSFKYLVSVIVPAYNSSAWIGETLDNIGKQTYGFIEIIIVDDGSSDNTAEVVKPYLNENVRYVYQSNKGASAARNKGLELSSGYFIQFLDADDLIDHRKIEEQVAMYELFEDKDAIISSSWYSFKGHIDNAEERRSPVWKDYPYSADFLIEAWTNGYWMPIFSWLVPKHIISKAGKWDESISFHDDGEFFSRVILASGKILFCGTAKGYYRTGIAGSLSSTLNARAVLSHFHVCELYEKNLLSVKNDKVALNAVASNFQNFIYFHYPNYPDLTRKAEQKVIELGGSSAKPPGTIIFRILKPLLGWKTARKLERLYYTKGLNYASLKGRLTGSKY